MLVRLHKYIADCQAASRRKAEAFIACGRVTVNGAVVTEQGVKVDVPGDRVCLDGNELSPPEEKLYVMLHKPNGYITSMKDQFGRPDVSSLCADVPARLFPVGRLDYDTSGLLIMTNDGDLAFKLTHPRHMVDKTYIARVAGKPGADALARLCGGVDIGGYVTAPCKAVVLRSHDDSSSIKITVKEGKNRQVRRMFDAVGCKVMSLKRVATGRLYLGDLQKGAYRLLTREEIAYLKSL